MLQGWQHYLSTLIALKWHHCLRLKILFTATRSFCHPGASCKEIFVLLHLPEAEKDVHEASIWQLNRVELVRYSPMLKSCPQPDHTNKVLLKGSLNYPLKHWLTFRLQSSQAECSCLRPSAPKTKAYNIWPFPGKVAVYISKSERPQPTPTDSTALLRVTSKLSTATRSKDVFIVFICLREVDQTSPHLPGHLSFDCEGQKTTWSTWFLTSTTQGSISCLQVSRQVF